MGQTQSAQNITVFNYLYYQESPSQVSIVGAILMNMPNDAAIVVLAKDWLAAKSITSYTFSYSTPLGAVGLGSPLFADNLSGEGVTSIGGRATYEVPFNVYLTDTTGSPVNYNFFVEQKKTGLSSAQNYGNLINLINTEVNQINGSLDPYGDNSAQDARMAKTFSFVTMIIAIFILIILMAEFAQQAARRGV